MAQHYPRHRAHYRDYDDDSSRRAYADEDVGPRRREPRRGGVIGTLFIVALIITLVVVSISLLPQAWQVIGWFAHPATTTTAQPTSAATPFPTRAPSQGGTGNTIIMYVQPTPAPAPAPAPAPTPQPTPYCGTNGQLYQNGVPAPRVLGMGCGGGSGGTWGNSSPKVIVQYEDDHGVTITGSGACGVTKRVAARCSK